MSLPLLPLACPPPGAQWWHQGSSRTLVSGSPGSRSRLEEEQISNVIPCQEHVFLEVEARKIPRSDAILGLVVDKLCGSSLVSQARFVQKYRRREWIAALFVRGTGYLFSRQINRPPLGFDDELHRRD